MSTKPMTSVYLIYGEDTLKRDAAIKRLKARFETMGDIDFNMENLGGSQASADEIIASCNTLPFASDLRLVIVRDVEKLSKNDTKKLIDYCDNPCATTILTLVANKIAKNSALYKAISRKYPKSFIDCTPKSRRELPTLVMNMAKVYGATIQPAAAELLISYVGTSTTHLDNELEKLAQSLDADHHVITEPDVARLVKKTAEVKPWELPDALSARDIKKVEALLHATSEEPPFSKMYMCCARIRDLIAYKALDQRGQVAEAPKILKRPEWQLRHFREWTRGFSENELRDALVEAAEVERSMKSGHDQDMVFETWLLCICRGVPFSPLD